MINLQGMAATLGVRVAWLKTEADAGRIPAARIGEGYLFDEQTVLQAIQARAAKGEVTPEIPREIPPEAPHVGDADRKGAGHGQ